jgi:hypothetical protein
MDALGPKGLEKPVDMMPAQGPPVPQSSGMLNLAVGIAVEENRDLEWQAALVVGMTPREGVLGHYSTGNQHWVARTAVASCLPDLRKGFRDCLRAPGSA